MDGAPWRSRRWQVSAIGIGVLLSLGGAYWAKSASRSATADSQPANPTPLELGRPSALPLPSSMAVPQFEEKLFAFLNTRQYVKLGWLKDKDVRDTGPYIGGKYYGTHPAVRAYYSPGVMSWLMGGRAGKIADGEMIIKEQYAPPALRNQGKTEEELWDSLESWAVMVKDSSASHDSWFWSNPVKNQCVVDNHQYPFDYPLSGFGLYCVRCHAATHSPGAEPASDANEFTFASMRNIAGFPGTPIQFRVDDSWRPSALKKASDVHHDSHPSCARAKAPDRPIHKADARFLGFFQSIQPVGLANVVNLPPATHDWVVGSRDKSREFLTSNQCMSCHAALLAPFGPSMFVPTGANVDYGAPGWNVSPYNEWRWTPMGLSGRDPVFYAQLESEIRLSREEGKSDPATANNLCETLTDACLRCHAAMGKRQFDSDHPGGIAKFSLDHMQAVAGPTERYGALGRDGVSCEVCHRMQPRVQPSNDHRPYLQYFFETSITGNFQLGKKGEIYGPFKDDNIAPYVMEHATGLKPKHDDFLKSSQLCGTCHTVSLPAVDRPLDSQHSDPHMDELLKCEIVPLFQGFQHHIEQATYLEWLNSQYENEINKQNPLAKSCQDCHMSRGLKDEQHGIDVPQIRTRIAAVQDTTYPEAENLAPANQLEPRIHYQGFRRHNFSGLNAFLLEMFNQFDDVLGVPKTDYMTGSKQDLAHAVDSIAQTARGEVASVEVTAGRQGPDRITARVVVQNKAGHRFPSGVGFRRAFLELSVVETAADAGGPERIVWASGRTNELGVLLGADGRPLPTEFFDRDPQSGQQRYQKHHEVITSPDQVQVYETLLRNAKGEFTTSFVRGCETVKDNRLLPKGWKKEGTGPALAGCFLEATYPDPETVKVPRYADGSGSDEVTYRIELPGAVDPAGLQVRATLYYQAMPPSFLRNLFETAPDGPATRRLHYLCSHLDLKGTVIENWKLRVAAAECGVK
jgi:hypothetical protein